MRAFIAIKPNAIVIQQLKNILQNLTYEYPHKLSLIEPDKLHLTLAFFADLKKEDLPLLIGLLKTLTMGEESLMIKLGKRLLLPDNNVATVLAYGVQKTPALLDLKHQLDSIVSALAYAPDGREFLPHITLARSKNSTLLKSIPLPRLDCEFTATEIILYESMQTPSHFQYRPIEIICM